MASVGTADADRSSKPGFDLAFQSALPHCHPAGTADALMGELVLMGELILVEPDGCSGVLWCSHSAPADEATGQFWSHCPACGLA